jgi:alkaline phosphatase
LPSLRSVTPFVPSALPRTMEGTPASFASHGTKRHGMERCDARVYSQRHDRVHVLVHSCGADFEWARFSDGEKKTP